MGRKPKDKSGTAKQADKLFRVLFKTPLQRELSQRDAEIASLCKREIDKGSCKMYVYEMYAKIYGLSVNHVGKIYREGVRYV